MITPKRPSNKTKVPNATSVLLAILVEGAGLVAVTAIAGISDQMANLMIVFVIGIFLLWLTFHSEQVSSLNNWVGRIEGAAK